MTNPGARQVLEDVRHHFVVLNGHYATGDATLIEALRDADPPVSYAMYDADYELAIDDMLMGDVSITTVARQALQRAQRLFIELRGMTFVEACAIQARPWFSSVSTPLEYDASIDALDEALATM